MSLMLCGGERDRECVLSLCVLFTVCAYDWHCGGGCIDTPWRVLARWYHTKVVTLNFDSLGFFTFAHTPLAIC